MPAFETNQGIDRERVERMEARLKEDILREADHYQGAIMVIHETDNGQIFDAWEHVSPGSVQTPLEVFSCLEADGVPIKYARVPITDGKAPKSSDFDMLAMNIASASKDTAFVFNCQVHLQLQMKYPFPFPSRFLADHVLCPMLIPKRKKRK